MLAGSFLSGLARGVRVILVSGSIPLSRYISYFSQSWYIRYFSQSNLEFLGLALRGDGGDQEK